jgi:signal transduction histidine kinase
LNIEGLIELKITNDGETLHQSAIDNSKGIGWKNIKARVALLQGEINLGPAPKSGTVTKIIFKRR